ncbi:hypothetical protein CFB3_22960 [Clostridium folliculivorans]|uniref:Uncharacterized protein n=1 Tax=Clostridium folliculivorans TaxID=2886038 RepID=A0A9W5Y001_9CLOT|nr:hypothetical protein [Clostridium folliculivorans]GKU24083.1 hypothetical protein CFOLD11_09090 [Clostridium folliculivorans]GKU30189.1 hypothetical protein CFB3_22960 [Clostridium folliculivorans]
MKSVAIKSLFIAIIFYPLIVIVISIYNMFNDKSFSFLGFNLILQLTGNSASASLNIKPSFAVSILGAFVISFILLFMYKTINEKGKRNAS